MGTPTKTQARWRDKLEEMFGFDLRSLALFRIALSLVILADLIVRAGEIREHYSDFGVIPRTALIDQFLTPWYWSINLISGQPFVQAILFGFAIFFTLMMLIGYRTRLATIAVWAMIVSIHNRNPALIFAADDVLRAILFWSMFLPLGACYSFDHALNTSSQPLPKRYLSIATIALIVQQCFIYILSAAFKHQSPIWSSEGSAVYYALNFDQYATPFGQLLLNLGALLPILTFSALWFEWLGPLMLFIPWRTSWFRCLTIVLFVMLHIGFGLCFTIGIFPFLSVATWLAFIPSLVWDGLDRRIENKARDGLKIYYDAECGFCKKVVYLLRTLLILPRTTPLQTAQQFPSVYEDMQAKNSWVVEDLRGKRHFKWDGIAYVVSLSPILWWLEPILRFPPLMGLGTKFYETIATNRRIAGTFTAPFHFRSFRVRSSIPLEVVSAFLLIIMVIWNFHSFVNHYAFRRNQTPVFSKIRRVTNSRTVQQLDWLSRLTRLDQGWSIFAPNPPRDDGWHIIRGNLSNGQQVDLLYGDNSIGENKPTIRQRNRLYRNMQWRTYFINLNRNIGNQLYPLYGEYLCRQWNEENPQKLESIDIYFMSERTAPPNSTQEVERKIHWQQSCNSQTSKK